MAVDKVVRFTDIDENVITLEKADGNVIIQVFSRKPVVVSYDDLQEALGAL